MSANPVHESGFHSTRFDRPTRPESWRILLSILLPTAWLSLTLLYVGFWAPSFSLFQSIIIIIVSIILLAGVLAATWVSFGLRYRFGSA